MDKIIRNSSKFFYWWLFQAPKKIFIILKRIIALINNELSFTLNLRLIFTPLFGDYTWIGRIIGFTIRAQEIIIGLLVIGTLTILTYIAPVLWYILPLILLISLQLWAIPLFIVCFVLFQINQYSIPAKKVTLVTEQDIEKSFRPEALAYFYDLTKQNYKDILQKLINEPKIQTVLKRSELLFPDFITKFIGSVTIDAMKISSIAVEQARKHNVRYVELEYIFYATLANTPNIDNLLSMFGASLNTVEAAIDWVVQLREELSKIYLWQDDYKIPVMGGIGKGMTGRVTPNLDEISQDFTKKARKGLIEKTHWREAEIRKIAQLLGGSNGNLLIIGPPGCGKTGIIQGIAVKIIEGTEFTQLKYKRIVNIDAGGLLAGTKTAGDIATKLKKALEEVESSGDIILFIDEIQNLIIGNSSEDGDISSAFATLEPYLSSGKIQFIGATNIENYRKHIEPNGSFAKLFELVEIGPASKEDTLEIIKIKAETFEKKYGVTISYPALNHIVKLSDKLMHERVFPDKAIDILNRSVVRASNDQHKYVTTKVVEEVISDVTKIPINAVSQEESEKLLHIEEEMAKQVIGQPDAIVQIGSAIKRARAGIRNQNKPIASFLFVGTTGVGKTETAKALARIYFGDAKTMIRLDMSEYQQIDSINRLIGTPDGKSKGILTEAVRTTPFALILLDEIEKAYSSVLLTFLQVLDDGRLTDSTGRVIDFTNTIIIATSNVGTKPIQEITERQGTFEEMKTAAMEEVRNRFAPEFLNRFNGLIVFRPLTPDDLRKITNLMLRNITNMAAEKNVTITYKPELIEELIIRGYNPQWGARPLARVIEESVESYIAIKLLSKELNKGDHIELGLEVFERATI